MSGEEREADATATLVYGAVLRRMRAGQRSRGYPLLGLPTLTGPRVEYRQHPCACRTHRANHNHAATGTRGDARLALHKCWPALAGRVADALRQSQPGGRFLARHAASPAL